MIRNAGKIIVTAFLFLFVSTLFPGISLAGDDNISVSEAKKAAVFQITMDSQLDKESSWHNKKVKLEEPIMTYDTSDSLFSYLFNISVDGNPAGFVEVSALKDEYPILSYSYEESDITSSKLTNLKKQNKDKNPVSEKVVVLGPGVFGLKQDFPDGSAKIFNTFEFIDLSKEKNILREKPSIINNYSVSNLKENTNLAVDEIGNSPDKVTDDLSFKTEDVTAGSVFNARNIRENINLAVGEIGNSSDGVTDDLSFETGDVTSGTVGYCPDLNQLYSSLWTGPAGCSPTSAANIMLYWADNGYPELTEDLSNEALVYELRQAMNTYYEDGIGKTFINNISPGMEEFAIDRGLSDASAEPKEPVTWLKYKHGISSHGPNIMSFYQQTYYGDHSVTGVGWKAFEYNGSTVGHRYMRVRDNRSNTPISAYIAFDRNYSVIYYDQFYPEGDN